MDSVKQFAPKFADVEAKTSAVLAVRHALLIVGTAAKSYAVSNRALSEEVLSAHFEDPLFDYGIFLLWGDSGDKCTESIECPHNPTCEKRPCCECRFNASWMIFNDEPAETSYMQIVHAVHLILENPNATHTDEFWQAIGKSGE